MLFQIHCRSNDDELDWCQRYTGESEINTQRLLAG